MVRRRRRGPRLARAERTPAAVLRALAQLVRNGDRLRETSKQLGIPLTTLWGWRQRALEEAQSVDGAATLQEALTIQERAAALWLEAEETLVERLIDQVPEATDVQRLATAAGIAADKYLDRRDGRKGTDIRVDNRQVHLHIDDALAALREARERLRLEATIPGGERTDA